MPVRTNSERLGILETKFETVVEPMAEQVKEIHAVLKDNGLCSTVEQNTKDIESLKKYHNPHDNGEERRKNTFQRMPLWQKVVTGGAILTVLFRPEVANILHYAAEWLQKLAK